MSVEINTLMALAVSLIALFYLKQVDPKRRRVYRLPKMTRGRKEIHQNRMAIQPDTWLGFISDAGLLRIHYVVCCLLFAWLVGSAPQTQEKAGLLK